MALPRVILVTGKGGTGKSTVAGALALALAERNKTMVADFDRGTVVGRLLGVGGNGGGPLGANLEMVSITARAELEAFIERIVPLRAVARRLLNSHTFGYVTAALPGLEAFLMLERMRLLAEDAAARNGFVVIDAPASGTLLELLGVAQNIQQLAPAGLLHRLAGTVDQFLRDRRRFGVLLTVRPEQLGLREGLETAGRLRDQLAIGCLAAILNAVPEALFSTAEIEKIHALPHHRQLALRRRATARFAVQARARLESAKLEVIELPMLYSSEFARPQLELLAGELLRSGLV